MQFCQQIYSGASALLGYFMANEHVWLLLAGVTMSVCALWRVQDPLFNIWKREEAPQWQMCFVVSGGVELWGAEPLSCEQSWAAGWALSPQLSLQGSHHSPWLFGEPCPGFPSLFPPAQPQPGHPWHPCPGQAAPSGPSPGHGGGSKT